MSNHIWIVLGIVTFAIPFLWGRTSEYELNRQIWIESSPEKIFEQIESAESFKRWMPAPEGIQKGSLTYKVDLGNPNIVSSNDKTQIKTKSSCGITGSLIVAEWILKPDGLGNTQVIVNYSGEGRSIFNKAVDIEYGRALSALKRHVETQTD